MESRPPEETPTKEEVLAQQEDMVNSGTVRGRPEKILRYVVAEALDGRGGEIKEYTVGVNALGLPETFDPNAPGAPTNVRVQAVALRKQLAAYYETVEKWRIRVIIEIPKGGYCPQFSYFSSEEQLSAAEAAALRSAQTATEKLTLPAFQAALDRLDLILQSHPNNPLVLAMKADIHAYRAMHGVPPRQDIDAAEGFARRAVTLAPNLWQAQVAYGYVKAVLQQWDDARAAFARAEAAPMPTDIPAHFSYTAYLISQGRTDEAIWLMKKAVETAKSYYGSLAPSKPIVVSDLAFFQIFGGRLDEAMATLESAMADSDFYILYVYRAILQEALNDPKGAAAFIKAAPLKWSESAVVWGLSGLFHGLAGDRWRARFELAKLLVAQNIFRAYVPASQFAMIYLGLGEHQTAIRWLRQSADDCDPLLLWMGHFPFYRHLAHMKEFNDLLVERGLSWKWKRRDLRTTDH